MGADQLSSSPERICRLGGHPGELNITAHPREPIFSDQALKESDRYLLSSATTRKALKGKEERSRAYLDSVFTEMASRGNMAA